MASRVLFILSALAALLVIAGCGDDDDDSDDTDDGDRLRRGLHAGPARDAEAGHAHGRHRQAGLPALLRGRRPDQRQGLRERGRLRDRRPARLQRGRGRVGRGAVQLLLRARARRTSTSTSTRSRSRRSAPSRSTSRSPYYTAKQAVVALKDSDAADATSLADLADAEIGVQIGTTSLDAVEESIEPTTSRRSSTPPTTSSRRSRTAQVDAVVVDLPTAFYLTAVQVPEAEIVGQFSAPGGDEWGALLEKDSPLTDCVSQRDRRARGLRRARRDRAAVDQRARRERARSLD